MSDSSKFGSSGSTAVVEPPSPDGVEAAPDGSTGPNKKVLAGVVAGVLVLALAAYFLLFSGGGSDTATSGTVPHGAVSAPALGGGTAKASAKPVPATVPKTVTGSARDPFAPLVVASAAPSPSASSASPPSTGGSTGAGSASVPAGLVETVRLIRLGSSSVTADVSVNGVVYNAVKPGVVFAKYFSLDPAVVGSTATFHFGDSTFSLAVGRSTIVRT